MAFLPDKDHPVWKIIQTLVSALCIGFFSFHGISEGAGHSLNPDVNDAAGVGGLALAVKLIFQWMNSGKTW